MKLLNVILVKSPDTGSEALYVLGKRWDFDYYGHGYNWEPLLKNHVVHLSQTLYVDEDWFFENFDFPEYLSEVEIDYTKSNSS